MDTLFQYALGVIYGIIFAISYTIGFYEWATPATLLDL